MRGSTGGSQRILPLERLQMRHVTFILLAILILPLTACRFDEYGYDNPTYPSGGEYDGGYGDGGGGGYGGGTYNPPDYDDGPDWSRDVEGEWEGFMWEQYRSDGRPLSKKKLAMRFQYADTTYTWSGRHEWVKANVVVDGRPAASSKTEVTSSGRIDFSSYQNGIDFEMQGNFYGDSGSGDIELAWDEKVTDKYTGETEMCYVRVRGDFELARAVGDHWGAAWALFDLYGDDGIWELPDYVWETATLEGLEHLDAVEETFIRAPVR